MGTDPIRRERVGVDFLASSSTYYFHVRSHAEENIGFILATSALDPLWTGFGTFWMVSPIMRRLDSWPRPGAFGSFFNNESVAWSGPPGP